MIDRDRQAAALTLFRQGASRNAIARQLHLDIKTVRAILRSDCVREPPNQSHTAHIDDAALSQLHRDCCGYVQRMHEILHEEHGVRIGYSTLTRLVRSKGLGVTAKPRSCRVPDMPGEEMQHDTSEHQIRIGAQKQKIISSGIYLRYSKMRYVRFYRRFNRFTMKCFFDEALRHWGYSAHTCIIDNTHLAILNGSGSSAHMTAEMTNFADNYGFTWIAHAIGHANRKAGTERNFYTIETNFLPGRRFASLEDVNTQAIEWATVRYAKRPQAKTGLVPLELFEAEKGALIKLPPYIAAPYLPCKRCVDQYGYCSFDGNFYWAPETVGGKTVTVLQYAHHLCIMDGTHEIARYDIAADGVKNAMITPAGHATVPRYVPKNRKLGCEQEETRLRELGDVAGTYLDTVKSSQSRVAHRPAFIRGLYALQKQVGATLFIQTLKRAMDYHVYDLAAVERIAHLLVETDSGNQSWVSDVSDDYRTRDAFRDGQFTDEHDVDYL
jgi:hypothetical protein